MNQLLVNELITSTVFGMEITWTKNPERKTFLPTTDNSYKVELLGKCKKGHNWIATGICDLKTGEVINVIDAEQF